MSKTARFRGGLASVIVDCTGPVRRVRRCIDALLRSTRRPWELIAVAEEGPCAAYLAGVGDAAPIHVEVVRPPKDAATFRHTSGIAAACGDYLILIDDGTIVSEGWLDGLSALAEWDPKIGMVGPMLSDAAPPQRADDAEALDRASVRQFADLWREEHRRQWITTDRLAASCVLIPRAKFWEAVADAPVRSVDDLAARVLGRGLLLAVIRELFVHHSVDEPAVPEGRSFEDSPRLVPRGLAAEFAPAALARPREDVAGRRPRVSLTMIVRDEEENLGPCLESAAGLFDEVVVVDTGSADRTAEVARSLGAVVVPFDWVDDFAAARNASLDRATGRFAFWLDADDRIDEVNRARLLDLFARLDEPGEAAYVMKQLSAGRGGPETGSVADHVRLFPIRDDVRWTYRVHEQILPAVTAAGVPVRWTEVEIGHLGWCSGTVPSASGSSSVTSPSCGPGELRRSRAAAACPLQHRVGGDLPQRPEDGARLPPREPGGILAAGRPDPQGLRPDRAGPPDARRPGLGPGSLRLGAFSHARRRRSPVHRGPTEARPRRPGGGRGVLATNPGERPRLDNFSDDRHAWLSTGI